MNHSPSPVLGVIGGLGPMATVRFLELVVDMTQAGTDQQHLDMIVYNIPSTPDRTGFLLGNSQESPLPRLLDTARALVRSGVSCIALPCVTAHAFLPQLEKAVGVPVIDCVKETAIALRSRGITRAGILATDGTLRTGLFHKELEAQGIEPLVPGNSCQQGIMKLIYEQIKAGAPRDMSLFHAAAEDLRRQGAEAVLLGCTELSLLEGAEDCVDLLKVLAARAIVLCGKTLRQGCE